MNQILETDRLILRAFDTADAGFIIRLLNTEGWLKYIGNRNVNTKEEALAYLENVPFKSYKENGFGLWAVVLKSSGEPVGMCGLIKRAELEGIDIGFAFLPGFTGTGLAFEIAEAVMNYAFQHLQLPSVLAITLPDNASSIKLLKKLGMQYLWPHTSNGEELQLFRKLSPANN
jgi:[ribosomal protein S5]-alanine N-acetyltransferase